MVKNYYTVLSSFANSESSWCRMAF